MAQNTFMRFNCSQLCIAVILAFEVVAQAAPFVVFPKAGQLRSPDGRFVVRNIDREAPLSEYVGPSTPYSLRRLPAASLANSVTTWAWQRWPGPRMTP
jgi:hypothetical protein